MGKIAINLNEARAEKIEPKFRFRIVIAEDYSRIYTYVCIYRLLPIIKSHWFSLSTAFQFPQCGVTESR